MYVYDEEIMIKFKKLVSNFFHGLLVKILIGVVMTIVPIAIWTEQILQYPWTAGVIVEGVIIVILTVELWKKCKYSAEDKNLDKEIFEKIISHLPLNSENLRLLGSYNWGQSLIGGVLIDEISECSWWFAELGNDLQFKFRDRNIEKRRKILFSKIVKFCEHLGWDMFPTNTNGYSFFRNRFDKKEEEKDLVEKINILSREIFVAYEEFYKLARKELKIN